MRENIYADISKKVGKDMRLVRMAAHHPFDFFEKVMASRSDHRPFRFRYLGAFMVKPYWYKGLKRTEKVGYPKDGMIIQAKVPEEKYGKTYYNLKRGQVMMDAFKGLDEPYVCSVKDIKFWVEL